MSATKIGENTTNLLKLLFFTINLHFVTSNQIYARRKLYLSLTSSIFFVFLPLEMQKRLEQTKSSTRFLSFSEKEGPTNLSKWQLQKPFSPVCMVLAQLTSMNALYYMWSLEDILFMKN